MIRSHRRRPSRRAVLVAAAAAFAGLTALACAELGTGVDDIAYVEFDGIPWPSVIVGDTLRDSLGVAAPLRASAFDPGGDRIAGAPFRYLTLDTGVVVDSAGFLRVTTLREGTVRVIASLDGIQTVDRAIRITRRPDSVFAATAARDTFDYGIPDVSTNLAEEMRVHLISGDSTESGPNVGGWLVRWRTVHAGDTLAAGDTSWVVLQSAAGARRAIDTTSTEGLSSRRLRIFSTRIPAPVDSFVVLAEVRRYGVAVPGSPVRFVLLVRPR